MEFHLTTFPRVRVAYYRHVGPYGDAMDAWDKLAALAAKHHLSRDEDVLCIGACYDDPANVPLDRLRSDVCITVDQAFAPQDGADIQELGGGRYVTARYTGPYSGIGDAYEQMYLWMHRQGLEVASGPTLEIYRNDPHVTPEDELITDLHAPIQ